MRWHSSKRSWPLPHFSALGLGPFSAAVAVTVTVPLAETCAQTGLVMCPPQGTRCRRFGTPRMTTRGRCAGSRPSGQNTNRLGASCLPASAGRQERQRIQAVRGLVVSRQGRHLTPAQSPLLGDRPGDRPTQLPGGERFACSRRVIYIYLELAVGVADKREHRTGS